MNDKAHATLQEAIETVEALPREEQLMLLEIIRARLREQRRRQLVHEVRESRASYDAGNARAGSVDDLLADLDT